MQVPGPEHDLGGSADSALALAMRRLSFDDQEILRLTAWERLAHAEIAEVLGCSVNAVAIRSHKAKRRLAAELDRRPPSAGQTPGDGGHEGATMPEVRDEGGSSRG